jgi:hypothetical protein
MEVSDEDVARAMWAEDAKVNEHDCRWDSADDATQELFRAYARVAREKLGRQTIPLVQMDDLKRRKGD